MRKDTIPLLPDTFYHIYNRSTGDELLFREEKNYPFFLQKYAQFITPYVDTYAYCLLSNHFHMLIRTKSTDEILNHQPSHKTIHYNKAKAVSMILGKQFGTFFKSYTNAINKTYNRTGGLFEETFRRKKVAADQYLSTLIYYIHLNPQKHQFCEDYKDYPHSSYHAHLSKANTKLKRQDVIKLFGSPIHYQVFHSKHHDLRMIKDLLIDF